MNKNKNGPLLRTYYKTLKEKLHNYIHKTNLGRLYVPRHNDVKGEENKISFKSGILKPDKANIIERFDDEEGLCIKGAAEELQGPVVAAARRARLTQQPLQPLRQSPMGPTKKSTPIQLSPPIELSCTSEVPELKKRIDQVHKRMVHQRDKMIAHILLYFKEHLLKRQGPILLTEFKKLIASIVLVEIKYTHPPGSKS